MGEVGRHSNYIRRDVIGVLCAVAQEYGTGEEERRADREVTSEGLRKYTNFGNDCKND